MQDRTVRLKRLMGKGEFGPGFAQAAREDLPQLWGRLSLLEEFYYLNRPGISERSRNLSDQLGQPLAPQRRGLIGRLRQLLAR